MMYRGWGLTDESRAELLKRFPPIYPVVRADHVTDILAGDGLLWQAGRQRMYHVTISRDDGFSSSDAGVLLSNSVQAIQPVPRMVLTTVPFVRVLGSKVER